jgi:hypothetical protein
MLGSFSEADDALQEAWLRLSRADTDAVANLGGWLTTVVGRVCLDMLRARRARREDYVGTWLPEPIVAADEADPVDAAVLAPDVDLARQREVVDAFLAASRAGDFEGLVAVLDPDAVFRVDAGASSPLAGAPITGAEVVARQVLARGSRFAPMPVRRSSTASQASSWGGARRRSRSSPSPSCGAGSPRSI